MKNKIISLFVILFCLNMGSLIYAFESPVYSIEVGVEDDGIDVSIGEPDIEVNIVEESSSSTGNGNDGSGTSGGTGLPATFTTATNNTDNKGNEPVNLSVSEEEKDISPGITGAVIGFAKSGTGIVTLTSLVAILTAFLIIRRLKK